MKLQLIFVMCLCVPYFGIPQKNTFKVPDSLAKKNYTYLDDKIYEFRDDNKMAAIYLLAYLHKSKNEKNWKEVVHAYQNFLHQSPEKLKLVYADSMIYAAKKSNDNGLIGSAYLSKGIAFYGRKQYDLASDNYSIANNYISKSGDKYLIYKVKHQMAPNQILPWFL
ncbi:hypothetical protein [Flavobacterium fluviatile]|uniref:hypothetical protein n=1 Tax=Flavobacterium fluviatile TaxID=1862387 RepID=UPI0013D7D3F8|nr:hypothetical protein [Flavobacterium fluviatile]